jgi:hypothetical protein
MICTVTSRKDDAIWVWIYTCTYLLFYDILVDARIFSFGAPNETFDYGGTQ